MHYLRDRYNFPELASMLGIGFFLALLLIACQEQNNPSPAAPLLNSSSNVPPASPTSLNITTIAPKVNAFFALKKPYPIALATDPKERAIVHLTFNPNGKSFAATTAQGSNCLTTLSDIVDGKKLAGFSSEQTCFNKTAAVTFSPDGNWLALAGDGFFDIKLINLKTKAEIRLTKGLTATVSRIVFSPDGKYLAANSTISANAYATGLWNLQTNTLIASLQAHPSDLAFTPDSLSLTPDSLSLITSEVSLTFWEAATGKKQFEAASGEAFQQISFSPDGKLLAGLTSHGNIIWDIVTKNRLFSLGELTGKVEDRSLIYVTQNNQLLSFSADSKYLLGLEMKEMKETKETQEANPTIKVWVLADRQEVFSQTLKRSGLSSLAISPDKKNLLVGYADGLIELWGILI